MGLLSHVNVCMYVYKYVCLHFQVQKTKKIVKLLCQMRHHIRVDIPLSQHTHTYTNTHTPKLIYSLLLSALLPQKLIACNCV